MTSLDMQATNEQEPDDDGSDEPSEIDSDSLLGELDDGEGQQPSAPATDSLDDLLKESLGLVQEAREAKSARDRLKRGGLSAAERAEDARRIAEWEAKHHWLPLANVAVFARCRCACGTESLQFQALMQRQVHRQMNDRPQRWICVASASAELPNEVAIRTREVIVCGECAFGKGWDTEKAVEWLTD